MDNNDSVVYSTVSSHKKNLMNAKSNKENEYYTLLEDIKAV